MNNFPIIETIGDVLPFVQGRKEFVVAERPWGTVIDYHVTMPDTFNSPQANEYRGIKFKSPHAIECRGIKFDADGNLIARPYHKFFNFGEPLMQTADVAAAGLFHEHFVILDKLDGSMIHPIRWNGDIHYCTRMGITDVAMQAQRYVDTTHEKLSTLAGPWYTAFANDLVHAGMTPLFEWCSREQRIVIDHPQDQLILTGVRTNRTGEYMEYAEMKTLAAQYRIPIVNVWEGEWNGIDTFLDMVHNIEEAEGFVLRWDNGTMGKSKGEWYLQIHRAKDHISFEKRVIGLILDDNVDDVLPFLLPHDYTRVLAYREDFWSTIDALVDTFAGVVETVRLIQKRTSVSPSAMKGYFAKVITSDYTGVLSPWKGLLFSVWDGKDSKDVIVAHLRKQFSLDVVGSKSNGSQAIVDKLRLAKLLPSKNWLDY
jgi:RNA ligase